jgi:hypothetical protein
MRNHNSKRELEKHVPYKAQKENSKQHDALLPMSAENGAVTWEKGTGALQKWPLFSIGHDSSTKDFFVTSIARRKMRSSVVGYVGHIQPAWRAPVFQFAGLKRARFFIRTILRKTYHDRIRIKKICQRSQISTQHNY